MKIAKILLFIGCILALLGGICQFFPREGVQIGGLRLEFPSLAEVLTLNTASDEDEVHELTPEELMELQMQAVMAAQDSAFLDFCHNSPIRISMPKVHVLVADSMAMDSLRMLGDSTEVWADSITQERNLAYLDTFFVALDSARVRQMRIVHYGDSQIEEDRITASLRQHFQEEFGGSGPGMQPAIQTVAKMTVRQSSTQELPYYLAYGPATGRARHRGYGPMAQVSHVNGSVTLRYTGLKSERFPNCGRFDKVTLLRSDENGNLVCEVQEYDSARNVAQVTVNGPADIYGVLLDSKTGVVMDNVPMRGCSGAIFTGIARGTLQPFFAHENVQMIILQYGGNSVPYLKTEESLEKFCNDLRRQIRYFQSLVPEARILFIGPSDMSTTVRGELMTYPMLPRLVEMLEEAVTDEGAAFWNMYEAMGGRGSMIQWVNARPQLAGEDYVHFTHKGAEKVSDLLYETISMYYKYFKFRRGEMEIELPGDSLASDMVCIDSIDADVTAKETKGMTAGTKTTTNTDDAR